METKSARTTIRSIPRWAYILFIVMAVFLFWRVYAKRRNAATVTQPPARPFRSEICQNHDPIHPAVGVYSLYRNGRLPFLARVREEKKRGHRHTATGSASRGRPSDDPRCPALFP